MTSGLKEQGRFGKSNAFVDAAERVVFTARPSVNGSEQANMQSSDNSSIDALILALMTSDETVRLGVIDDLAARGDRALDDLIAVAAHDNERVRAGVISALGKLRPASQPILRVLVDRLADTSPPVRQAAHHALVEMGPGAEPVVPLLRSLLEDPNPAVRSAACWVLRSIGVGASDAIPALRRALRDPATYMSACQALIRIIPGFSHTLVDANPPESIIDADEFVNHACSRCGNPGLLFATPRMFSACPKCLVDRIRKWRKQESEVPAWADYLEGAAGASVQGLARKEDDALGAAFEEFYRCGNCGKLVVQSRARYHFAPGAASSPPYCPDCYELKRTR
jgi:hypothetical protein